MSHNQTDLTSPGTLSSNPLESNAGAPDSGHDPVDIHAVAKHHLTEMTKALSHLQTASSARDAASKTLRGHIKKLKKAHKNLSGHLAKAASSSADKQSALQLMMDTAGKVCQASKDYKSACKVHKTTADATQAKVTESILGLAKIHGGGAEVAFPPTVSPAPGSDREKGSQAFSEIELSSRKAHAVQELTKIAERVLENHFAKTTKLAPTAAPQPQPGVGDRSQKVSFTKAADNGTANVLPDSLQMTPEDWQAYRRGDPKAIRKAQAATSLKWSPVPHRILERLGR